MNLETRKITRAKKKMAGNSNDELTKWKKKEKKTKDDGKGSENYMKHVEEMEDKAKQLPPIIVRHSRGA